MKKNSCESCLMPFDKDPGTRENDKYCSLCFRNGEFCYKGNDLKEFQKMAYKGMTDRGMNKLLAKIFSFSIRFAPRWRNPKQA